MRRVRAAVARAIADLPADARIGVACSGGADSVAVADAAVAVTGAARVVLVHVDHGLHAGAAEAARAVEALAARLGAGFHLARVTVGAGASLEAQARAARYAALDAAARDLGLATILSGHTARDQAETVLLRALRGTGPGGLAGIARVRGVHRRPLLDECRAITEAYVAARALPVADDPMNADRRFARVRLREALMPALVAENPRVEDALCRLARSAAEWAELVDARAAEVAARAADGTIAVADLVAAGPAAGKRALQLLAAPAALDADHLDAAWALATAPARGTRGLDLPGLRLERRYGALHLTPDTGGTAGPDTGGTAAGPDTGGTAGAAATPDTGGTAGPDTGGTAGDNATPDTGGTAGAAATPDTGGTAGELVVRGPDAPYEVRRWRAGDRMRPARLRGRSRKLSDLYVDAKVPRAARARARVVVDRAGTIVWAEHVGIAAGADVTVTIAPTKSDGAPRT